MLNLRVKSESHLELSHGLIQNGEVGQGKLPARGRPFFRALGFDLTQSLLISIERVSVASLKIEYIANVIESGNLSFNISRFTGDIQGLIEVCKGTIVFAGIKMGQSYDCKCSPLTGTVPDLVEKLRRLGAFFQHLRISPSSKIGLGPNKQGGRIICRRKQESNGKYQHDWTILCYDARQCSWLCGP